MKNEGYLPARPIVIFNIWAQTNTILNILCCFKDKRVEFHEPPRNI